MTEPDVPDFDPTADPTDDGHEGDDAPVSPPPDASDPGDPADSVESPDEAPAEAEPDDPPTAVTP